MSERHLGQTLGKYRVDALIGSGGFAWVYKAWDPDLEIPVALKVLKPQYAGDETFESRFRREASTAARLRHPNIVKIFAVGKEGGAVYFAMDYLPQNLTDRLEVMTALPEPMLLRMGIDVASALGFAHREGVIHRDIKVDNILFDDHGNAVVADFGIARAVSNYVEHTGTNMVVGTPQYFSPEQARGQPLDGRADIYSLGVTLFRAATGSLPFNGDDWYEIARQQVEERPPKPRSINPALSRDIERVILRCLEKEPEDRYPSGEELCHALAALAGDSGGSSALRTLTAPGFDANAGTVAIPTLRRPSAISRAVRRHRGPLGTAAAVGLTLLIAVPLINARRRDEAAASPAGPNASASPFSPKPIAPSGPIEPSVSAPTAAIPLPASLVRLHPPELSVTVPPGATLAVNGTPAPLVNGTWRSGALATGTYSLVAELPGPTGCSSLRKEKTVVLADTGVRREKLTPRPCGWLRVRATNAVPATVRYTLRPAQGGGRPMAGPLMPDSLTLPEGQYALSLDAPYCSRYSADIGVTAGRVTKVTARMLCGK